MRIESKLLIDDLLNRTKNATARVLQLKKLDIEKLQFKKDVVSWSILECIEHLNLYGDFYLPEIEKQLIANKTQPASAVFKSGLIGNYFAGLMLVKDGKMKKMKSPSDKNPANKELNSTTIERFLTQQERLKLLLVQSKNINLIKTKSAISLSRFVKLRLGDTFRFVIYHIERHIAQAEGVAFLSVQPNELRA